MKFPHALLLFACLLPLALAISSPLPDKNVEIEYLIDYVANSQAAFLRNDKEYTAQEGADHLR